MKFTVPNLLSLLRMGLVPLFIIALVSDRPMQALVIFLIAGLTDALDGLIARFWQQQSRLGAYLDPMADKLLLVSAYATLALPGLEIEPKIPVWVAVLVIARDVVIVIVSLVFYLAADVKSFPPARISKLTTVVQVVAVLVTLIAGVAPSFTLASQTLLYLAAGLTVASGLNYVLRANRLAEVEDTQNGGGSSHG